MNKISFYYAVLILFVAAQFVTTVIGKSIAVQKSASVVDLQRRLDGLEQRETALVNTIAEATSLAALQSTAVGYENVTKPVQIQVPSLVAAR